MRRQRRKHKKDGNDARIAVNILVRESFEPFLMITNDADVVYHSAQSSTRVTSSGSSPPQPQNKNNNDASPTSRIEFDVN